MLKQRLASELGQNINGIDSGIDEITQNEVNNSVFAAERDCRFCAFFRQRIQPGTLTTS